MSPRSSLEWYKIRCYLHDHVKGFELPLLSGIKYKTASRNQYFISQTLFRSVKFEPRLSVLIRKQVFTRTETVYVFGTVYISSLLVVLVNRFRTVLQAEVLPTLNHSILRQCCNDQKSRRRKII